MDVNLKSADIKLRSMPLTRSLLKQAKKLEKIPGKFRIETEEGGKLNPQYCIGYVHGSVVGDEFSLIVLFVYEGDLFTYNWPGFKPESWCKRIYVG